MNATDSEGPISPLIELGPREAMDADKVKAILADMKQSLTDALRMGCFDRMEYNHWSRKHWWPGQTLDGRKWQEERDKTACRPGEPREVFPWNGSSDVRVGLVDQVIRERTATRLLALQRRQERIGPRELSPDDDPDQKAVLWGQTSDYYADKTKLAFYTAAAQASDIAQEYGAAVVYTGWRSRKQVVPKTMTAADLQQVVGAAAQQVANDAAAQQWAAQSGDDPEDFPGLTPAQNAQILKEAGDRLQAMIADDKQRPALIAALMAYDSTMPKEEARRVAKGLRLGQPVGYYGTEPFNETPEFRALTPWLDVFFPATSSRVASEQTPWVAETEWITAAELRSRGYDEAWVEQVLTKSGTTFLFNEITGMDKYSWVMTRGIVGSRPHSLTDQDMGAGRLYQIIHCHYRAIAIGEARAVYHTVLHGQVPDMYGAHECCEEANGQFPFSDVLADIEAPFLIASEGAGERSLTHQNEIKVQRDLRSDAAAITIKPPILVPWTAGQKQLNYIAPGRVIPMATGQGASTMAPLALGIDPKGSMEVEMTTMDAFNELWGRGVKLDPVLKQTLLQKMVTDYLMQIREVRVQTFQLIQQYAPDQLKAAFINGLKVNLDASREEIQGEVSLEMDFDVSDLDGSLVEQRLKAIAQWLSMDTQGLVPRAPLLKALGAYLLPSHYKLLVTDPDQQAKNEVQDEQNICAQIQTGTQFDQEGSFVIGTNHQLRLQTMQGIYGVRTDEEGNVIAMIPNGPPATGSPAPPAAAQGQAATMPAIPQLQQQPSQAQMMYHNSPDIQARVNNRLKFHARQIVQRQVNPTVGRTLVKQTPGGAVAPVLSGGQ